MMETTDLVLCQITVFAVKIYSKTCHDIIVGLALDPIDLNGKTGGAPTGLRDGNNKKKTKN